MDLNNEILLKHKEKIAMFSVIFFLLNFWPSWPTIFLNLGISIILLACST